MRGFANLWIVATLIVAAVGAAVTAASGSSTSSAFGAAETGSLTLPPAVPDSVGGQAGPDLDVLASDCRAGSMQACDELYIQSPAGSAEESIGASCGGRQDTSYAGSCSSAQSTGPSTYSAPSTTPPPPPTSYGIVDISAVSDDGRAIDVAGILDIYFSGINSKDITAAVSVFDPAGILDPGNAAQVADFADGVRTTTDTDVRVQALRPDPSGKGEVLADVTFTSRQAAVDGPEGQVCTNWTLTYTLTQNLGRYFIRAASGAHHAC